MRGLEPGCLTKMTGCAKLLPPGGTFLDHLGKEEDMRYIFLALSMALFLSGCASVWPTTSDTLYFHESKEGSRYYALAKERTIRLPDTEDTKAVPYGFVWVTPDGTLRSSQGALVSSLTKDESGQWDLSSYSVEKPIGYCIPLWSPHVTRPESCWNRLWEVPSMLWLMGIGLVFVAA